jgi:hypothetical protein
MATVPCGTGERYSSLQSLRPRVQVQCTTWYSLPYGTYPEGPRRGCTVPPCTLRVVRGTVRHSLGGCFRDNQRPRTRGLAGAIGSAAARRGDRFSRRRSSGRDGRRCHRRRWSTGPRIDTKAGSYRSCFCCGGVQSFASCLCRGRDAEISRGRWQRAAIGRHETLSNRLRFFAGLKPTC